ncbi:MAG: cytochrome c3 family protein [Phycisphaerae bacterium]
MRRQRVWGGMVAAVVVAARGGALIADDSIVGSPHDLSCLSPHAVRAVTEDRVCIFCHVPHNAQPQAPLWNRFDPQLHYRIYQSSTTDARVGQPSGPSKMCLSCHDGLMAIGLVGRVHAGDEPPGDHPIVMTRRFMPPGASNLTNDLSDDHPIGFRFDRALFRRDGQLHPPEAVSREIKLGKHGEVHCTACHDPHNNRLGDFLRISPERGALCLTCHDLRGWHDAAHATAVAATPGRRVDPAERLKFATLAENACAVCHTVHSAGQPQRLLRFVREEDNCLNCHDGAIARTDILSEIRKLSAHRSDTRTGVHDPAERGLALRPHAECVDCHNPHAARPEPLVRLRATAPRPADGALRGARGVTLAGLPLDRALFAYEVCFRCHADQAARVRSVIPRLVQETNTRREFEPYNPSFHPVANARLNPDVVSLTAGLNAASVIACTDCHNADDARRFGGAGPNGPHGSRYFPILGERYETRDFNTESAAAYALCYRCHDRTSILRDDSFPLHRLHIVVARAPCSVCHDPHGVPASAGPSNEHSSLINFDLRSVRPVTTGAFQPIRYRDTGRFSGTCTLTCHGVDHVNTAYGTGAPPRGGRGLLGRIGR